MAIDCKTCVHFDDDDFCEDCTVSDLDRGCTCFICPPCSYCVGSLYEEVEKLFEVKLSNRISLKSLRKIL